MSKEDEDQVSPMAAAMLVLQERSRAQAKKNQRPGRAAFFWGALAATGFFAVALLIAYLVFVCNAEQERLPASGSAAPVATTTVKPTDKAELDAPASRAADEAGSKTADRLAPLATVAEKSAASAQERESAKAWFVPKEIVARCGPSVALIIGHTGSGSGFLVGPNLLATNAHVLRMEFLEDLRIFFPSAEGANRGPVLPDAIVYEDERRDLALVSVPSALPPLGLAHDEDFAPGEEIIVIGSPGLGNGIPIPNAINQGILSTKLNDGGQILYQLGASVNPGNSGGPVFNSTGKVVGIATARGKGVEALAFSIPAGDVQKVLERGCRAGARQDPAPTARHRAAVAFRKLDALCTHYGTGLDQCVEGMIAAVKKHRPLEDGIRAARTLGTIKINDNVVNLGQLLALDNQRLLPGLEAAVSQVAADPLVDQMAKDKLLELQATRNEMKDYLDKPRGTLLSFQNKRTELRERHQRLGQLLRGLLSATLP